MTPGTRVQHPTSGRVGTVIEPAGMIERRPSGWVVVQMDDSIWTNIYKPADLIEVKETEE